MSRCKADLELQGHLYGDADGYGMYRGIGSCLVIYLILSLAWCAL